MFESVGMSFHPFVMNASFHERYLDLARGQLDERRWSAAWAEGREMTLEEMVAEALAESI